MLPWTRPPPIGTYAASAAALLEDLRRDVTRRGEPHIDDFKTHAMWTGSWPGPDKPGGSTRTP